MFNGASASDPMPAATAIGLALMLIAAGVVLAIVAVRSSRGAMPRNWIVGIRTVKTMESDDAWKRAHRAAAASLGISAVGTIGAGLGLLTVPSNGVGLAVITVGLLWMLGWILRGGVLGHRAAEVD